MANPTSMQIAEAILKFDALSAANAVMKALFPEQYGKDIAMLAGREIARRAIEAEMIRQAGQEVAKSASATGGAS